MANIVNSPTFRYGDENLAAMQQFGQNISPLLAALTKSYMSGRGGTYTSPTGETAQISPAEKQLSQMLAQRAAQGQGQFTPRSFGPFQPGPVALEDDAVRRMQFQQMQQQLARGQAEAETDPLKKQLLEADILKTQAEAASLSPNFQQEQMLMKNAQDINKAVEIKRQEQEIENQGPYGQLLSAMAKEQGLIIPGVSDGSQAPVQEAPVAGSSEPIMGSTRAMFDQKKQDYPGQTFVDAKVRELGQFTRERETQKGLTEAYSSRTAQTAKDLGDTANVAVEERKMIKDSYPQDTDSVESRIAKEESIEGLLSRRIDQYDKIINMPNPMKILGFGPSGPSLGPDPALAAMKKEAAMNKMKFERALMDFRTMFQEANELMPPIGAIPKGKEKTPELSEKGSAVRNRLMQKYGAAK